MFDILRRKKKYDIETLATDKVLNKEHFYGKIIPKASPRLLFYFGNQPKTAIPCKKFLLKQDILKGDYQKSLKK